MKDNISYLYPGYETLQNSKDPVEDIYNSDEYKNASDSEQRCFREGLMWGFIEDATLIKNKTAWNTYFNKYVTGIHEAGHELEVNNTGGTIIDIQVFKNGGGITRYMPAYQSSIYRYYLNAMRVGWAGGEAVAAEGIPVRGCGFDHGQIEAQSRVVSKNTNFSGEILKSEAKGISIANISTRRELNRHRGHQLGKAA